MHDQHPDGLPKNAMFTCEKHERRIAFHLQERGCGKIFIIAFLGLWLTLWTAGCIALLVGIITKPSLYTILFAIPFLIGWVAVFGILMTMCFGRESVTLDDEGVSKIFRVLTVSKRRFVPLNEVQCFWVMTKLDSQNKESYEIQVEMIDDSFGFGTLNEADAAWIARELNLMLAKLQRKSVEEIEALAAEFLKEDQDDEDEGEEVNETEIISLKTRSGNLEPPLGTRWTMLKDFETVSFRGRGTFELGSTLFLTIFTFFWNGGVSVFVFQLLGEFEVKNLAWWGLLLFLTPFVGAGVFTFICWLKLLFSPLCVTTWTLSRNTVQKRLTCLFFTSRREHYLENCRNMMITQYDSKSRFEVNTNHKIRVQQYKLAFLGDNDEEICHIPALSYEEAKWFADAFLTMR